MKSTTVTEKGSDEAAVVHTGPTEAPGSWLRERAWLLDLVVALGVFAYNLPILPAHSSDPTRLAALTAISVGMCGLHLLRHRYPLAALGVMLVAASSQLLIGTETGLIAADVVVLFAVYNVATRFRWPISLAGAAAVVAWLVIATRGLIDVGWLNIGDLGVLVVLVMWVWTWGTLVRVRRDHIAGLQERARQLEREKEAQARLVAAEERTRIARDTHDIVSHSLSVVVVMSDGAASTVGSDPERARSAMLAVRDTGRTALTEMRRMLGVLRDGEPGSHAPQPGIAQLDQLIGESRAAGLPAALTVAGEAVAVPAGVDLSVYRLVQEALTNVRKHAGPSVSRVDVGLRYGAGELEVRIVDDGHGRADAGRDHEGHGLVGIQERVAAYGGGVRAGPRPSGGFEVVAVLPVREDHDDPSGAGR